LSPELVAALEEPPTYPGRELLRLLRADGFLAPTALLAALGLAAGGVVVEALLLRGLFDLGAELGLFGQRLAAMAAILAFAGALLLLELPTVSGLLRLGRRLETRLRAAFLEKVPRLGDRYFHSRLTSDMAERSHSVHQIRLLPDLGGQLARSTFELVLTAAGIAWLDPPSAPTALLAATACAGLPLLAQPFLTERDLRFRTHTGALSRFYLDALLGLVAVRAHRAERPVRREHESLLVEWARAGMGLQGAAVAAEGVQFLTGFGLAAWLLLSHLSHAGETGSVLLLAYWALNLPVLGQEVALVAWQYPAHRNVTLRLLEPLGAREEGEARAADHAAAPVPAPPSVEAPGVAIAFDGVSVRVAGHTILQGIELCIEAGTHVAIVGPSGAGKSSLVGLLLGWHHPATGGVRADGVLLDGTHLERLRQETAWVDPMVQLWNRSLLDNLVYGAPDGAPRRLSRILEDADLRDLLRSLPDGLQATLGEAGALVSGGEGQRVRLGRAMIRGAARLAILDEPFRGLDRERRRQLMVRARAVWREATLLCITHDVGETRAFDRVLVVEGGRIVEDAAPAELAERAGSRYRAMLDAERAVREGLWSGAAWRRLRLEGGRLVEEGPTVGRA
jgi:ATP-binding cassette subfamily B protein